MKGVAESKESGEPGVTEGAGADDDNAEGTDDSVLHEFRLCLDEGAPPLKIKELPIEHADNPFGTDDKPEDDTTGMNPLISSAMY